MNITKEILQEYQNITSYDMPSFFQSALTFLNGDYQTIVNYYSGITTTISSSPFNNFKLLKQQRDEAFTSFDAHKQKLNNLKWFLLLENLEDIDSRLKTLDHINKWSRSSLTKVGYDPNFQLGYVLGQGQTLEKVSSEVVGDNNPEDDWINIALANAIKEEDYSPEGGTYMTLKLNKANGFNFKINSVVDTIQGKSVYGKDLDANFGFDTANNDLKVLDYDSTIQQAAYNLITLKRGDVKSAPTLGLQQNVVVGTTRGLLNFPVINRQLATTFAADDSLKDFTISQISFDQDNLIVKWSVKSRLNEVIANEATAM